MQTTRHCSRIFPAIATLALMLPAFAQAQVDRDTQEISSYVLTDAGLARYTKAAQALGAARKQLAANCDDDDDSNPQSLDQIVAKFNSHPGAKAALQGAGMTTREYIVFSMSIFQTGMASWALSQPGGKLPPGVSMANVNFYRKNEASVSKLSVASDSDDCDAEDTEEPEDTE
jgi:hypothetical protein